jgi:hypothetical protein
MSIAALLLLATAAGMSKDEAVELARKAVAERLGAAVQVQLVRATAAEWADSSLGCRGERKREDDRPVSGYRVLLRAGGTIHRVHVAEGKAVVCGSLEAKPIAPRGHPPGPRPMPDDPEQAGRVARARDDLAARLGVAVEEITLVENEEVVWPDGSLGCPRPGLAYTQSTREGWLIRLEAGRRIFEYHSGVTGEPFYCADPRPPVRRSR